jgi:hypothetical protein
MSCTIGQGVEGAGFPMDATMVTSTVSRPRSRPRWMVEYSVGQRRGPSTLPHHALIIKLPSKPSSSRAHLSEGGVSTENALWA